MQTGIVKKLTYSVLFLYFLVGMGCSPFQKFSLDPSSEEFYETVRLIMSKEEKDIFLHLPDKDSREEFIADFWVKRDPDPNTEENEFKQAFFRRVEYANKYFIEGIPGWKTDRGRIYIYLGPPDRVVERPFLVRSNIRGLIIWGYYKYRLGIEFVDRIGNGCYKINQSSGAIGGLLWAIDAAKFGLPLEDDRASKKKAIDFDLTYDKANKEIVLKLPVSSLVMKEEESLLKADLNFEFFIYGEKSPQKNRFKEARSIEMEEEEILNLDDVEFRFPYDLTSGKYYIDVIIVGSGDLKVRRIFKIKV